MNRNTVNDQTTNAEIFRLAQSPKTTLNITDLSDLSRLPTEVNAGLYTEAETLNAPVLRTVGAINAPNATTVLLPQLEHAGNIYVNNATTFTAPRLHRVGQIFAYNATTLILPRGS